MVLVLSPGPPSAVDCRAPKYPCEALQTHYYYGWHENTSNGTLYWTDSSTVPDSCACVGEFPLCVDVVSTTQPYHF